MKLSEVRVENFGCIRCGVLPISNPTAIIGPNGAGKSTFLRALEAFFEGSTSLPDDRRYARDPGLDVRISLTLIDLGPDELREFAPYIQHNSLIVTRVFPGDRTRPSGRYYAQRRRHPAFADVRRAGSVADKRSAYNAVRTIIGDLPPWQNQQAAHEAIDLWEQNHLEDCVLQDDDGQFFGFTNVGQGNLSRNLKFVYIPAVYDTHLEAQESKASAIGRLMAFLVRSVMDTDVRIQQLKQEFQGRFEEITKPENIRPLNELSSQLSGLISRFYPEASVSVLWQELADVVLPSLKADVLLNEYGFSTRVPYAGHGLQRAFVISILQHLADVSARRSVGPAKADGVGDNGQGRDRIGAATLLLAIEEPELYQHPASQRHLHRVLCRLGESGEGAGAAQVQVIYSTHSPAFVDIQRFACVRRVSRRRADQDRVPGSEIVVADGDRVAAGLWRAASAAGAATDPFTFATLGSRLHIMTAEVNEGFFADVAVLVEGTDDQATIKGAADARGIDLEALNIAVISCGGKNNIDKPYQIFTSLGISTYVVWDGDSRFQGNQDKKETQAIAGNRLLLGLIGTALEDWPSGVYEKYTVFKDNLDSTIRQEIGEQFFDEKLQESANKYEFVKLDQAKKNPNVLADVFRAAVLSGRRVATLDAMIDRIIAMRSAIRGDQAPASLIVAGV